MFIMLNAQSFQKPTTLKWNAKYMKKLIFILVVLAVVFKNLKLLKKKGLSD